MMVLQSSDSTEQRRTDEDLARLAAGGQVEVFAQIYERYYARTYRLAYGMTGARSAAEELTQEIFIRAYQRLHQFAGAARFSTWFYRLAVNCALNFRARRERNEPEREDDAQINLLPANECVEGTMLQLQLQREVRRALLSLKPELRVVVILKDIEGLSYEEIAARTGCASGTIASRLNRARALLARKLAHLKGTR
jgi:RNA polymerase sigma-70 factor (ECF subfamily)